MPGPLATSLLFMLLLGSSPALLPAGSVRADGVQLLLEAERPDAATEQAMAVSREIIERRIEALGSAGTVVREGPNRILVTLARRADAVQVKQLIGRPGRLEFRPVDESVTPEQMESGRAPAGSQILPYPDGGPGARIAVRRQPIVDGRMVVGALAGFDEIGMPAVTVRFDAAGSSRFARATRENVGRTFAIVIDNVVMSAPTVREPILGGVAQINGSFTVDTANQLAIALGSGPLPVRLRVVEERVPPR